MDNRVDNSKNIVVGVSGGIAAYKACELCSRLVKLDYNVNVIMTKAATSFVTELTFRSITHNEVCVDFDDKSTEIRHIALATKADCICVVPATANIIGKLAHGIADDLLTTTIIATKAPVLVAPAMNTNMLDNPITRDNIRILGQYGYHVIDSQSGVLACGIYGDGKLARVDDIVDRIVSLVGNNKAVDNNNVIDNTALDNNTELGNNKIIGNNTADSQGLESKVDDGNGVKGNIVGSHGLDSNTTKQGDLADGANYSVPIMGNNTAVDNNNVIDQNIAIDNNNVIDQNIAVGNNTADNIGLESKIDDSNRLDNIVDIHRVVDNVTPQGDFVDGANYSVPIMGNNTAINNNTVIGNNVVDNTTIDNNNVIDQNIAVDNNTADNIGLESKVDDGERVVGDLVGKTVLITAGATSEPIDPVRYITNRSSGKMGKALAIEAHSRGAKVIVVKGHTRVGFDNIAATIVEVSTTKQMLEAVKSNLSYADYIIMAAAPSDYRVVQPKEHKIKGSAITLRLVKNADIAAHVGACKGDKKLVIFAAETDNLVVNAREKMIRKHANMVVANDVTLDGAGFDTDTNIVTLIDKTTLKELPIMPKADVARAIIDRLKDI